MNTLLYLVSLQLPSVREEDVRKYFASRYFTLLCGKNSLFLPYACEKIDPQPPPICENPPATFPPVCEISPTISRSAGVPTTPLPHCGRIEGRAKRPLTSLPVNPPHKVGRRLMSVSHTGLMYPVEKSTMSVPSVPNARGEKVKKLNIPFTPEKCFSNTIAGLG